MGLKSIILGEPSQTEKGRHPTCLCLYAKALPGWLSGKRADAGDGGSWVRKIPLEKEMATHSSTLAWRIPWREKPGKLHSMGLQRVGHGVTSHSH